MPCMGNWGGGWALLSSVDAICVFSFTVNSSCFIVGVRWSWKSEKLCLLGWLYAAKLEILLHLLFLLVLKAGTLCSLPLTVAVWSARSSKLDFCEAFSQLQAWSWNLVSLQALSSKGIFSWEAVFVLTDRNLAELPVITVWVWSSHCGVKCSLPFSRVLVK